MARLKMFIDALEPRRLFSAATETLTADLSNALAEFNAVRHVLTSARATEATDRKAFLADLGRPSRANAELVAQLERDAARGWAATFAAETALSLKGTALCRRDAADGVLLLKRPANAALNTRVSAEAASLAGAISTLLSGVQSQFVAANQSRVADFSAIVSANPTVAALASDLQTLQSHLGGASGELSGTVALAQSQIGTFANDLASAAN